MVRGPRWGRGCFLSRREPSARGAGCAANGTATARSDSSVPQKPTETRRNPQKPAVAARAVAKTPPGAARALAAARGAAGVTLPQFPKIGPVCDRITRAARVCYGAGRSSGAGQGATSAFSLLTSPSWHLFVCLPPPCSRAGPGPPLLLLFPWCRSGADEPGQLAGMCWAFPPDISGGRQSFLPPPALPGQIC